MKKKNFEKRRNHWSKRICLTEEGEKIVESMRVKQGLKTKAGTLDKFLKEAKI